MQGKNVGTASVDGLQDSRHKSASWSSYVSTFLARLRMSLIQNWIDAQAATPMFHAHSRIADGMFFSSSTEHTCKSFAAFRCSINILPTSFRCVACVLLSFTRSFVRWDSPWEIPSGQHVFWMFRQIRISNAAPPAKPLNSSTLGSLEDMILLFQIHWIHWESIPDDSLLSLKLFHNASLDQMSRSSTDFLMMIAIFMRWRWEQLHIARYLWCVSESNTTDRQTRNHSVFQSFDGLRVVSAVSILISDHKCQASQMSVLLLLPGGRRRRRRYEHLHADSLKERVKWTRVFAKQSNSESST